MRLKIYCSRCAREGHQDANNVESEYTEDPILRGTCSQGHKVEVTCQIDRFTILYEFALMALDDGYYREAFVGVATATERFYELMCRAICVHRGIDPAQFELAWKEMSRQSERQMGAFLALYLSHYQRPPKLMPKKWTETRNNCTHKGYLPTKSEALDFARDTYAFIVEEIEAFRVSAPGAFDRLGVLDAQKYLHISPTKEPTEDLSYGQMGIALALSRGGNKFPGAFSSFDEALVKAREARGALWRAKSA